MKQFLSSELIVDRSINLAQLVWAAVALWAAFACGCARSQAPAPSAEPSAASQSPAASRAASSASPPPAAARAASSASPPPAVSRVASSSSAAPSTSVPRALTASTRAACSACKGEWAIHGVAETESCNCRTADKGKICRDGRDCGGECIVEPALFEVVDPGPPPRGYFRGRCSEFVSALGCNALLSDGARDQPPVPKDQAPEVLCVD